MVHIPPAEKHGSRRGLRHFLIDKIGVPRYLGTLAKGAKNFTFHFVPIREYTEVRLFSNI